MILKLQPICSNICFLAPGLDGIIVLVDLLDQAAQGTIINTRENENNLYKFKKNDLLFRLKLKVLLIDKIISCV